MTPLLTLHARTRFLLESAGGPGAKLRLFCEPVQFDPSDVPPNVKLSSPASYSRDLAAANGPFETLGWPEMTNAVKDDVLADRAFLDHIAVLRAGREKRLLQQVKAGGWDCIFAMFAEPDRVQHALYRHVDEKSPRHDPKTAAEFGPEIDRAYTEMDRIVGEVAAAAPPDTQIVVCSDHGFAPFRRGVNLNNFLVAHGYQVRTGAGGAAKVGDLSGGRFFTDVRWEETQAYAMGLGNLYLNLAGREARGSVKPADTERVLAAIEKDLRALTDTDGTKVVHEVYRGRDLYHGARAGEAPDLVVGFEWGWRVSWQSCLGAMESAVITDNSLRWSGDHCSVDPSLVPGVLFSTVPLDAAAKPKVPDVTPSVLSLFGLDRQGLDGRSFFRR
jgi:predicted AlkP superfamily phosphohydrolase/phosphomutase